MTSPGDSQGPARLLTVSLFAIRDISVRISTQNFSIGKYAAEERESLFVVSCSCCAADYSSCDVAVSPVRIEEREGGRGKSGRLFKERAAAERILCKSMGAICSSLWMDVQ